MISFEEVSSSNYICRLDLDALYTNKDDILKFDKRWIEFYASDETNSLVFRREGNVITYPHKSWIPITSNKKPSVLIIGGNPAPHSVLKDIYYAYEGKGIEHRFWKVLRELNYINLFGSDPDIKQKFLNLEYESPFRLGFECIFTFPSTPSKPKWSGVIGLEKLFGKKYLYKMYEVEKRRVTPLIKSFIKDNGVIIAMQKDAYNALAENSYNIQLAVEGKLESKFEHIKIFGTPPTRWLHTQKMKRVLADIRDSIESY